MSRPLLVIGAAGFSGRALARAWARRRTAGQSEWVGVDLVPADAGGADGTHVLADASDATRLSGLLREIDPGAIVNLSGVFASRSSEEAWRVNVGVSDTLLSECVAGRISPAKVLVIGSAAEYGEPEANPVAEDARCRPLTTYGLTKLRQTELALFRARADGVPVVVARPFNLTGPGAPRSLAAGRFAAIVEETPDGGVLRVGNLGSIRDFLDVDAAAGLYLDILSEGLPGEIYNVCSGQGTRLRDFLDGLIAASGKRLRVEIAPELLRANDVAEIVGDPSKVTVVQQRAAKRAAEPQAPPARDFQWRSD